MSYDGWPANGMAAKEWELRIDEAIPALKRLSAATPDEIPLETLTSLDLIGREAAAKLSGNARIVLIKGLPINWLDNGLADRFYFQLCIRLGKLDATRAPFYDVYDRKLTGRDYVRYADTNQSHGFHTDSTSAGNIPRMIGLLCVRQAMQGGGTRLINIYNIYKRLADENPEVIEVLGNDFPRQTRSVPVGDIDPSAVDKYPILSGSFSKGTLSCRYMRRWIDAGYVCAGYSASNQEIRALDYFDKVLINEPSMIKFRMESSDLLIVDNTTILHDREEFESLDDNPRLMRRAWIY